MRNMPTGQFVPGHSLLHKLTASAKLMDLFLFLATIIATSTFLGYLGIVALLIALIKLSNLTCKTACNSLLKMRYFFLLIFCMNALFYKGENIIWSGLVFRITMEGVIQGAQVVVRVGFVIVLSNLFTCTTAPMEITAGLEQLMKPFSFFYLQVEEIAMIISVAIQFIPTLMEETEMIRKAQISRGAQFESKKITKKAASVLPLVIPIFISAFRRADELSMAMEARGYRNARQRTKRKFVHWKVFDHISFVFCTMICMIQVLWF